MPLEISFDCRAYNNDKTPDLKVGAHFILSDGCSSDLNEGPLEQLTEPQRESLRLAKGDHKRNHKICFLPLKTMDFTFGSKGVLKAVCTACGTEYSVTREQYDEALEQFKMGNFEPYKVTRPSII